MRGVKSISKEKKKLISISDSCAVAQLCIEASHVHGPWSEVVRFRFLFWHLLLESLSTSDLITDVLVHR